MRLGRYITYYVQTLIKTQVMKIKKTLKRILSDEQGRPARTWLPLHLYQVERLAKPALQQIVPELPDTTRAAGMQLCVVI